MRIICIAILAALLATFNASAEDAIKDQSKASTDQERQIVERKELAYLIAPIKTEADLREYLSSSNFHMSPLIKLSDSGRDRFLRSLTFNEKGLTSFHYEDLQQELTVSQVYQVLALFGAQDAAAMIKGAKATSSLDQTIKKHADGPQSIFQNDYIDFACTQRATCTRAIGSICMSGC